MAEIHVLDKHTAELIAAGEVDVSFISMIICANGHWKSRQWKNFL